MQAISLRNLSEQTRKQIYFAITNAGLSAGLGTSAYYALSAFPPISPFLAVGGFITFATFLSNVVSAIKSERDRRILTSELNRIEPTNNVVVTSPDGNTLYVGEPDTLTSQVGVAREQSTTTQAESLPEPTITITNPMRRTHTRINEIIPTLPTNLPTNRGLSYPTINPEYLKFMKQQ